MNTRTDTPVAGMHKGARFSAAVAALSLLVVGFIPTAASAVLVNAIETVVVNPGEDGTPSGDPINLWDGITIQATWVAPSYAVPGDTFEMALPDVLDGVPRTFPLAVEDSDTPAGTCVVQSDRIVCTFSDYLTGRDEVKGTIDFFATVTSQSYDESWTWDLGNGQTIETEIPGGIGDFKPGVPTESSKYSYIAPDGRIAWTIRVLGSDLIDPKGEAVTLTDTYDSRLTLAPDSFMVQGGTAEQVSADGWIRLLKGTGAEQYEVTFRPEENSFDVRINAPVPEKFYRIVYRTPVPDGTIDGDVFNNNVTANGSQFVWGEHKYQDASGTGSGTARNGEVSWNKVDNDGVALAGSEWTVTRRGGGTPVVVIDNGTNDADPAIGGLKLTGMQWGQYELVETKAPAGYSKTDEVFIFTITGTALSATVADVVNSAVPGEVTWNKVDPEGTLLAGSEWTLTPAEGDAIAVVDNGENDADPADGIITVTGLAWGEYTLAETKAPVGHELSAETATVTIGAETLSAVVGDVVNERILGEATWNKVDTEGTLLAGSEWTLTPAEGDAIAVVDNGENDADPADGIITVTGLAWGVYTLAETKAPTGYVATTETQTITIGADALVVAFEDVVNELAPEPTPEPSNPPAEPGETPSNPSGQLPVTGAQITAAAIAAVLLALLGVAFVVAGRRSSRADEV